VIYLASWVLLNSWMVFGIALLTFSIAAAWWGISDLRSFEPGVTARGAAFLLIALLSLIADVRLSPLFGYLDGRDSTSSQNESAGIDRAEPAVDPSIAKAQVARATSEVHQIVIKLPRFRQLRFKKSVPLDIETPEQARNLMREEMRKRRSEEQLHDDAIAGAMMALWPMGYDLAGSSIKNVSEDILGFYNPSTKRMVLVRGDDSAADRVVISGDVPSHDYGEKMTLAHELTHALQDQYFNLASLDRITDNDDRELAMRAVVEGDATYTGLSYTFAGMQSDEKLDALWQMVLKSIPDPENVSAPDTLKTTGFVYGVGARFVASVQRRGGWQAVNELFRNPPRSTHQMLNPELYFEHAPPPARISIHGYEHTLPEWRKVDENTLGQVLLELMLHQNLGDAESWRPIGNAWMSDRYVVLKQNAALTVVWFIAFSDADTASHFAYVYTRILDLAHGGRVPHVVDVRGGTVLVLIGESASRSESVAGSLWANTDIGRRHHQPAKVPTIQARLAAP